MKQHIMEKQSFLTKRLLGFALIGVLLIVAACNKNSQRKDADESSGWEYGDVYTGKNDWVQCTVGNMPLIISIPHGGTLKPDTIADRECPDAVTVRDMNTIALGMRISEEMKSELNKRPYLIVSNLSRKKLDQNRNIEEATCGNDQVKPAWKLFHNWIDTALHKAVEKYGFALYIDLHGHGHAKQRIEIGYRLSKGALKKLYNNTNSGALLYQSSIYNLLKLNQNLKFKDVLMGTTAFGSLMADEGIPAVPSIQDPYPLEEDPYFKGGYNTERYTSDRYPKVFGWQIENNFKGVRDTPESRSKFAKAFVASYKKFMMVTVKNK